MKVSEFNFDLPEELIAQEALAERSSSRLLVLDKASGQIQHSSIAQIESFLKPGDLLVVNNSRVLPARLIGKVGIVEVECFLLKRLGEKTWEALIKPGKKISAGDVIVSERNDAVLNILAKDKLPDGKFIVELSGNQTVDELLEKVGHIPLPPYIKRADSEIDRARYQTVYAKALGSVAAPTAGLHFTHDLLEKLQSQGVDVAEITLHVGYGTFKPVRVEDVEEHQIDPEFYEISDNAADKINQALSEGRRIIAVGTTTTRTLESVAGQNGGRIIPGKGSSSLFIYPGYEFKVVSGLITNFHLPQSSLLMLVSSLAGKDKILKAYGEAIKNKYRFYSYGDAMLIV